ncbi:hypothetical protein JD844_008990 [Phrynosoma platyrhinos]|uniref:E3 ubiquitin-protein ligase MARCHF3 n=1 Tax=Phrynosoma platyrhinos TaxID=52577 RepID=A0ABQ7TEL4_PHRPL|nr:hypothetical protein JD844_008990 [Phrynosoma platyrhinos]
MTTSRCSHLPEVLPDCTSSAAPPVVKAVEDCGSLVNGQPQYVMQVSAKDGQLLSTVVRTLATQRLPAKKAGGGGKLWSHAGGKVSKMQANLRIWKKKTSGVTFGYFPLEEENIADRKWCNMEETEESPDIMKNPFNDRPMCRICHEGSSQEDLLSPCECTGTLGTIHRSCLEHWLSSSNTTYCELCHFRFAVERKPRPLVEVSKWGMSSKA